MDKLSRYPRLLAVLLICAGAMLAGQAAAEVRSVEPDEPAALPTFELRDHQGRPFTGASLIGQWDLTLLGFTHCPDVCPFVLSNLAQLLEQMSLRVSPDELPRVIFVAVDQKRDEPILADYVGYFHPDFLGVTGEWEQISVFVEGVDGFARLGALDADGDYEVQHSASVIVVAPDGRIHAKLSPPLDPGAVAEYLTRKQIAYRRGPEGDTR